MNYENFVKQNQKIIQAIKDRTPGDDQVDMYYGTLDVATARFHTILLKISQDRLAEYRLKNDVDHCFNASEHFTHCVQDLFMPMSVSCKLCFQRKLSRSEHTVVCFNASDSHRHGRETGYIA